MYKIYIYIYIYTIYILYIYEHLFKTNHSKHYVSFLSNHPKPCLKNMRFCLARRICMIVEKKNVRYMKFKELRTTLKTQQYPEMIVEKGIEKGLAIPQEQRRSEKLKNDDNILPFIFTHNPNNLNAFSKVREIYGTSKPQKFQAKYLVNTN